MKIEAHYSLSITHDEHRVYYESLGPWLTEYGASESVIAECMEADSVWIVHVYPDTPVAFRQGIAATLPEALERAGLA